MHGRAKLAEFKSELGSGGDAVRDLVRGVLQKILEEEMTEALGGEGGVRVDSTRSAGHRISPPAWSSSRAGTACSWPRNCRCRPTGAMDLDLSISRC